MTDRNELGELRVLVVGGGFAGMCTAVNLSRLGADVELIDIDPQWRVYGAGITITGPTLRAYKHFGLVEEIAAAGTVVGQSEIHLFSGPLLDVLDEPHVEGADPVTAGIMRPILHEMMQHRVREQNIPVALGVSATSLEQHDDVVDVEFSDGRSATYDLVVGADGIYSSTRQTVAPDAPAPQRTGQGCWRIAIERSDEITTGEMYFGGENPAGITLCGDNSMYMWLLTPDDGSLRVEETEGVELLREKLAPFGGTPGWIRDNMNESHWVNYRPLETLIVPKDQWVNGRVVLIGDAAHATTPHLASGAGLAVEDAVVLGEELSRGGRSIDDSLAAFVDRRFDRCKDVVDTGVEVGNQQLAQAGPEVLGPMIGGGLHRLAKHF